MIKLYFGQQNLGTVGLFGECYFDVPIERTPHYRFLKGDERFYVEYLRRSRGYLNPWLASQASIEKRIESFRELYHDIKMHGLREPVIVCEFGGRQIIYHGNHRAACLKHLKWDILCDIIPLEKYIEAIVSNPDEHYGTAHKGLPYQSVYYQGQLLYAGRRSDLMERFALIDRADIKGKTVLDIGCNIGTSSFWAAEAGAKEVIGCDISPSLANAALRLNVLFRQNCRFEARDFSQWQYIEADTAFAFSVYKHVNNEGLLWNLTQYPVVYWETHVDEPIPKADRLKLLKLFRVELRGSYGPRRLYRLVRC